MNEEKMESFFENWDKTSNSIKQGEILNRGGGKLSKFQ
jgi:hypothetical protein